MDGHPGRSGGDQPRGNHDGRDQNPEDLRKMKQKQLLILLVLVVALGAVGYILRRNQQDLFVKGGSPAIGKKLFADLPINDVTQIVIKHATDELNLVRKDDSWRVRERNDYP